MLKFKNRKSFKCFQIAHWNAEVHIRHEKKRETLIININKISNNWTEIKSKSHIVHWLLSNQMTNPHKENKVRI